jgi:multicomponent Na+:H+ antiporter subunit C
MSASLVYLMVSAALFGVGLYGLLTAAHVLRKLLALNIMGGAAFLLLVALAARDGAAPDPVAQALVLTGIVVAVATTAFALALMVRLHAVSGSTELEDE